LDGGLHDEAEPLYKRAIKIFEHATPINDEDIGKGCANLAYLYREQGRFAEAEPLFQRALELVSLSLPADHVDVAKILNNLALVVQAGGRFTDAEVLHKKALTIYEKQLAEDDLERITCLSNLALLYHKQGKLSEAETYYIRVLALREKSPPQDDPTIARSLSNLGGVYLQQGRFPEAETYYKRALSIRESRLPELHPDLTNSLANMAALFAAQSLWDAAAVYARRAQSIAVARAKRAGGGPTTSLNAPKAELTNYAFAWLVEADWQLFQAESFRAAQWSAQTAAGSALAQLGARLSIRDEALGRKVRERQDLVAEWQNLDALLIGLSGQRDQLYQQLAELDRKIRKLDDALVSAYPSYSALAIPEAQSVTDVIGLIHDDEALIQFAFLADKAYVWVLTSRAVRWVKLSETPVNISLLV